jgi:hypothetical protein
MTWWTALLCALGDNGWFMIAATPSMFACSSNAESSQLGGPQDDRRQPMDGLSCEGAPHLVQKGDLPLEVGASASAATG